MRKGGGCVLLALGILLDMVGLFFLVVGVVGGMVGWGDNSPLGIFIFPFFLVPGVFLTWLGMQVFPQRTALRRARGYALLAGGIPLDMVGLLVLVVGVVGGPAGWGDNSALGLFIVPFYLVPGVLLTWFGIRTLRNDRPAKSGKG